MAPPQKRTPEAATPGALDNIEAAKLDVSRDNPAENVKQPTSRWRQTYKVHPAADVFPMMSDDELAKLGEDIKANGLKHPIICQHTADDGGELILLDGRNRLEAMERAGIGGGYIYKQYLMGDPVAHIIGLNIHRRHLTKAEQADLIVAAVKAGDKLPQREEVSEKVEVLKICRPTEEVSEKVEVLTICGTPTGIRLTKKQVEAYSKGGRGKVNKVKAKAVAVAKEHGISKATVERSFAKAEGKPPLAEKKQRTDFIRKVKRARCACEDLTFESVSLTADERDFALLLLGEAKSYLGAVMAELRKRAP